MAARRRSEEPAQKSRRPATTPEQREHQVISQAIDLAEQQIQSGTASSQVITHFLKLGSTREQLEQERVRHENELLKVKRESLESAARVEELYTKAIESMRMYQGVDEPVLEDEPE
jgi:transposase